MLSLFDLLGVCLGAYTAWSAFRSSVFVRHHAWGRTVLRDQESGYFWCVIAIYAGLSGALIAWF